MNHNLTKYLLRLDLEGNYKPNVAIHGIVKLNNCSPAGSTNKSKLTKSFRAS